MIYINVSIFPMAFTRDLRIKITSLQYEIIKNKAQVSGYKPFAFIKNYIK